MPKRRVKTRADTYPSHRYLNHALHNMRPPSASLPVSVVAQNTPRPPCHNQAANMPPLHPLAVLFLTSVARLLPVASSTPLNVAAPTGTHVWPLGPQLHQRQRGLGIPLGVHRAQSRRGPKAHIGLRTLMQRQAWE